MKLHIPQQRDPKQGMQAASKGDKNSCMLALDEDCQLYLLRITTEAWPQAGDLSPKCLRAVYHEWGSDIRREAFCLGTGYRLCEFTMMPYGLTGARQWSKFSDMDWNDFVLLCSWTWGKCIMFPSNNICYTLSHFSGGWEMVYLDRLLYQLNLYYKYKHKHSAILRNCLSTLNSCILCYKYTLYTIQNPIQILMQVHSSYT